MMEEMTEKERKDTKFPSPTGVLYLLMKKPKKLWTNLTRVSVPYWGSLSSNNKRKAVWVLVECEFPSPTGVLYLLMVQVNVMERIDTEFPSPTGVLYLLILWGKVKEISIIEFPSPTGVLYLLMVQVNVMERIDTEFPSPTGVLYLLISYYNKTNTNKENVSVPYWGSLSSNSNLLPKGEALPMVSVPYWGSLSSNNMRYLTVKRNKNGFPSPTGVLYLLIELGVINAGQ